MSVRWACDKRLRFFADLGFFFVIDEIGQFQELLALCDI